MPKCPSLSKQPKTMTTRLPIGLCFPSTSTSTFDIESKAENLVNEPHDFNTDLVGIFDRVINSWDVRRNRNIIKASMGTQRDANISNTPPFCCLVLIEISFYDIRYKI